MRPTAPPPAPPAAAAEKGRVNQEEGGSRINDASLVHALQLFDARLRINEDAVADLRHTTTT